MLLKYRRARPLSAPRLKRSKRLCDEYTDETEFDKQDFVYSRGDKISDEMNLTIVGLSIYLTSGQSTRLDEKPYMRPSINWREDSKLRRRNKLVRQST